MTEPHHRNRPLRLLLVGRRFWPLCGFDSAAALTRLSIGLSRANVHVEVATAKFTTSCPDQFQFRQCTVHRAIAAPRSDWTLSRYTRHLTQWLRPRLDSFDAILVDSIREETVAVIEASRGRSCSVLLLFNGCESDGDVSYWQKNRSTNRCAAIGRMADAVVTRNPIDHRSLLAHQYDESKLHHIATPIPTIRRPSLDQQSLQRDSARRSLAAANSDLATMPDTPVLLCHARMNQDSKMDRLVVNARSLVVNNPDFRIWFLGDGPARDGIHSTLRGDGIRSNIAMPGSFCDLDDLMSAADAYIQPGNDSMRHFMPLAVAHDLPLIACDDPSVRSMVPFSPEYVHWFQPEKEYALRKQVIQVFRERVRAKESAVRLRQEWMRYQPESKHIEQLIHTIEAVSSRQQVQSVHASSKVTK